MMRISEEYMKFQPSTVVSSERSKWQWFENYLGALDGTHIPVTVLAEERPRYRNRKGDLSTNVLGVCAPDLRLFMYYLDRRASHLMLVYCEMLYAGTNNSCSKRLY
ncbi:unnamed protein product [Prunus armeniaca]|uniref:DDE Tnp4 domain-containing protein n=1 Tax=Prunus armeniaca TaxID=36596 RepID=A0A6J5VNW7_PRUAR|nr:unnamed protein product [Prunus armeniaca]